MKVRIPLGIVAGLCVSLATFAQKAHDDISREIKLSGAQYTAYRGPQKQLTWAPEGYTPYYISHYGRHGSRYLIGTNDYEKPLNVMKKANEAGVLTEKGKETMHKMQRIWDEARGRDGELTPLGAQQHKEIAKRMYERFPEVFAGKTNIDAKSTTVIRCILSMENALQQLLLLNPKLNITHDASNHDMYYMNLHDNHMEDFRKAGMKRKEIHTFNAAHTHTDRFTQLLFTDQEYVKKNVNAVDLMDKIFQLASNMQSTELRHEISLYDLFTSEEVYDLWLKGNGWWYINYGPSPFSESKIPFSQRNLLRMIISEADSCLTLPHPGATLRFGHDTMVMPLVNLLDLNGFGSMLTEDLEKLDDMGWNNYEIFPMATNVQFIFYAPEKDIKAGKAPKTEDILMKVLLCEDEATLPIQPYKSCYYKWSDFKAYYLEKLSGYKE